MSTALYLLLAQSLLGAFDTLYYHEYRLKLPRQPHARRELRLHAYRDAIYALLLATLGWVAWQGWLAALLLAFLIAEIAITLTDFVEEDRTRRLPPGERVMHALMGIVYGLFLAQLFPQLLRWGRLPAGFSPVHHGAVSWLLSLLALGVFLSGIRDYLSGQKRKGDTN